MNWRGWLTHLAYLMMSFSVSVFGGVLPDSLLAPVSGGMTLVYASEGIRFTEVPEREHTLGETAMNVGILYGASWGLYYLTQSQTIRESGSFEKYRNNLGKVVMFDYDEPRYNWVVHTYTGSQTYLFYRARGYGKLDAFKLTALQALLFEFTIETVTEPASLEDMINTPILGSVLGRGIEVVSLKLLNHGAWYSTVLGHLINPATMFSFYEGRVQITPQFGPQPGVVFRMEF